MSLASIMRSGIRQLEAITKTGGLQARVTWSRWIAADEYGTAEYDVPVEVLAVVDETVQMRRTAQGELVLTRGSVLFTEQLPPHGAPHRTEPIDMRDIIILPNGTTGPIISVGGPIDGETQASFISEILLGMV